MKTLRSLRSVTRRIARACIALAALALPAAASANPFIWHSPVSGVFNDPANWDVAMAPQAADDIAFTAVGAYSVLFTAPADTNSLSLRAGDVQFDMGGFNCTTGLWEIGAGAGQDARLSVVNGGALGALELNIGVAAGAFGQLVLSGPGTQFLYDDRVVIGRLGEIASATVLVQNGARLSDVGGLAVADIHGDATFTGVDSVFRARDAEVTGRLSFFDSARASVESWTVAGELNVHNARIVSEIDFTAAAGARITLTGATIDAQDIGMRLTGASLTIDGAGFITTTDLLFHNSELEIILNASSFTSPGPLLFADSDVDLTGSELTISLAAGFTPSVGQSIHLLHADSDMIGLFTTVDLRDFSAGLSAQVEYIGEDVFLTIVPAPGSIALFCAGALVLLPRRR